MADGPYYAQGIYEVECIDSGLVESKEKKTPGVELRVKVNAFCPGGDDPPIPEQKNFERTINVWIGSSEEGRELSLKKLRTTGWEGDSFSDFLSGSVKGNLFYAECSHVSGFKDQNRLYERWELMLPEREHKPIESKPALARSLNALFGKSLKESKPATPPRKATPAASVASKDNDGPPDDEIPF